MANGRRRLNHWEFEGILFGAWAFILIAILFVSILARVVPAPWGGIAGLMVVIVFSRTGFGAFPKTRDGPPVNREQSP